MSTPEQLVFDLPTRPAQGRDDFFVAPSNSLAVSMLDTWPDWTTGKLALVGPRASGKSHLVEVWAAHSGGKIITIADLANADIQALSDIGSVAVEGVDGTANLLDQKAAEESLFHLHNALKAAGGTLLFTGIKPPSRWPIALPDLASRLNAAEVATLDPPDDTLLSVVLVKMFTDRQIEVAPDLIQYLLPRIDRSFEAARQIVETLDRAGLSKKRAITSRLAGEVLKNF